MEREAARIREQEAELEAALEAAERALDDTVAHRAELERELAEEERRLKDAARAIADRREGLARLNGQVNAARSRAASAAGRDRPAGRRPRRGPRTGRSRAGGVRGSSRPRSTAWTRTTRNWRSARGGERELAEAEAALDRRPGGGHRRGTRARRGRRPPRRAGRSACAARTAPAPCSARGTGSPVCSGPAAELLTVAPGLRGRRWRRPSAPPPTRSP